MMKYLLLILFFTATTYSQMIMNMDRSKHFNPTGGGTLNVPTSFTATPNNSTGVHTLDGSFDVDADSVIVKYWSNINFDFAKDYGYVEQYVTYAVADFPKSLLGKYFDEKWYYQLAIKNESDTSDYCAVDSAWIASATGSAIYYALTATGDGSGSNASNAKEWTVAAYNTDIASATAGDSLLLKCGEEYNSGSTSPVISRDAALKGDSLANIYFGSWGSGAKPIMSINSGGHDVILFGFSNTNLQHVTFENLDIRGRFYMQGDFGDTINQVKILNCNIGAATTFRGGLLWWSDETNVFARDSIQKMYVANISIIGCTIFGSNNSGGDGDLLNPNGNRIIVKGCTFYNSGGDGIDKQWGNDVIVEDCDFYNLAQHGIKWMGQRGTSYNGIIRLNRIWNVDVADGGYFGMYLRTAIDLQVYNNTFVSLGFGFEVGSWIDNTSGGTELVDLGGGKYEVFRNDGLNFYNNIVYSGTGGGYWHYADSVRFVYKGGDSVLVTWGTSYFTASTWTNNLFKFNSAYGSTVDAVDKRTFRKDPAYTTSRTWWNGTGYTNSQFHPDGDLFEYVEVEDFFPTQVLEDNLFRQFAVLVDSSAGNLRLQVTSPAIGYGIRPPIKYDADGTDIQAKAEWDLGAYQYVP